MLAAGEEDTGEEVFGDDADDIERVKGQLGVRRTTASMRALTGAEGMVCSLASLNAQFFRCGGPS